MKKYDTRRNLLHKAKLGEFTSWAQANGYILHPRPAKAVFEVARLELYDPCGSNPHIVIYERHSGDHLTVEAHGVSLVQEWLRSKIRAVAR